ncbi:ribonuclease P protein subunit p14 isoform X1 [Cololabis saira]|uniref:ribonuclease P protein subunit p14 isoform X1 n=1 Tax=Cololabis saira TaxID=129043 RepID=UPI002AD47C71|nr:ribonuclease P protein subunit p14 isoform X1 [Cololabis saira]
MWRRVLFGLRPPSLLAPPPRRRLHAGQRAALSRTFSPRDLELFAALTGDANPLHLDAAYAARTAFDSPIVPGVLLTGLMAALLGTRLPGPGTVLLHQEIRFPAPLYPGEEVTAEAEVRRVKMAFAFIAVSASVRDKLVMEGEVVVMVPEGRGVTVN